MLKSKSSGHVQEVILPDFPDDDNTVTTTVTKSRRVSFGTNFVKEFIVGSAVSAQCIGEYEQAFPSSDSSNADSSHSAAESEILDHSTFAPESHKPHKSTVPTVTQTAESDSAENRPKPPKFSSTICFSADSPTADMEFTEGCLTLAKSILDKKNKEMTVIIQAKPKETKDEEKPKEDETKYFDASQFDMSVTRCLKSKENKREEKRFESEKTKIYSKFEDEMSITTCHKVFNDDESDSSWEECKENRMPLDMIMRHLDKDNSDLESDLFNPEKTFSNLLDPFDLSNESEKLNLNESMDISTDFQPKAFKNLQKTSFDEKHKVENNLNKLASNESMEISSEIQNDGGDNPNLSFPDNRTTNSVELNKICTDSEQFNQVQPECDESPMETMPFDLTKGVEMPLESKNKIVESEELETDVLKETEDDKIVDEKPENENTPEKSTLNESENVQSFKNDNQLMESATELPSATEKINEMQKNHIMEGLIEQPPSTEKINEMEKNHIMEGLIEQPPSTEKINEMEKNHIMEGLIEQPPSTEKINEMQKSHIMEGLIEQPLSTEEINEMQKSHIMEGSIEQPPSTEKINKMENSSVMENVTQPSPSIEKINQSQSLEPESSEITNPVESKIPESPCEQMIIEKSTDLSISNKSNSESAAELNPELQQLNAESAAELQSASENLNVDEPMEICSEETVNNVSKQNFEEVMEIGLDIQQNVAQIDSEKPNMESMDLTANIRPKSPQNESAESTDEIREPSLVDVKVIENLKEQSKEPGCVWSLKDLRHPQTKTPGLLSFNCELLESTATIQFILKISNENNLNSCSNVTDREIRLNEEIQCRLPEYELVIGFGFQELKKYFDDRQKVETIRHIPYFLDQINSFMFKMNSYLRQIHSILTLYPGSRFNGSLLSFRLYSFPIFFSSVVSIDLTNLFRLSKSSLSFENDFGSLDENKISNIFQKCLKHENFLCEFVIQSTKYLFELEKESGCVSKRSHIRLLPVELKL